MAGDRPTIGGSNPAPASRGRAGAGEVKPRPSMIDSKSSRSEAARTIRSFANAAPAPSSERSMSSPSVLLRRLHSHPAAAFPRASGSTAGSPKMQGASSSPGSSSSPARCGGSSSSIWRPAGARNGPAARRENRSSSRQTGRAPSPARMRRCDLSAPHRSHARRRNVRTRRFMTSSDGKRRARRAAQRRSLVPATGWPLPGPASRGFGASSSRRYHLLDLHFGRGLPCRSYRYGVEFSTPEGHCAHEGGLEWPTSRSSPMFQREPA